jgi:hypothetical protein
MAVFQDYLPGTGTCVLHNEFSQAHCGEILFPDTYPFPRLLYTMLLIIGSQKLIKGVLRAVREELLPVQEAAVIGKLGGKGSKMMAMEYRGDSIDGMTAGFMVKPVFYLQFPFYKLSHCFLLPE